MVAILGFAEEPDCVDVYNSAAVRVGDGAFLMVPSEYRHWPAARSHAFAAGNDGVVDVRLAVSSDGERFGKR